MNKQYPIRNTDKFLSVLILLLPGLSLLYLVRFSLAGIPTNVYEILIYLVALAACIRYPAWRTLNRAEITWAVGIVVLSGVALVVSDDLRTGFGMVKGWILPAALLYWMLSRGLSKKAAFDVVTLGMIAQGFIVALIALVQRIGVVAQWWSRTYPSTAQYLLHERSVSFFNSPNACAMILAPSFIISLAFWRRKDMWLVSLVLASGLLFTQSRAGLAAALLGALVLWLVSKQNIRAAYALIIGSVAVMNPLTLNWIAHRNLDAADIRVHIWQKSWDMLCNHSLFGYGLTNFQAAFGRFTAHQPNFDEFITPFAVHPHNIFLYTWFLFGAVGLLALVIVIVRTLSRLSHYTSPYQALGASLVVAFTIQGMVDNSLWKNDLIIWFVVALLLTNLSRPAPTTN